MKKNKMKCIQITKRQVTEEEKVYYQKIFEQEEQKWKRDELAGGVQGDCYIRLHDRHGL